MQTLQRQAAVRKTLQWRPGHAPGQSNRLQVLSMAHSAIPEARGLFDPANDKDACGVGFIGAPPLYACAAPAYGISSQQSGTPPPTIIVDGATCYVALHIVCLSKQRCVTSGWSGIPCREPLHPVPRPPI